MNSLSKLSVGDEVAMLVPMTDPDLDGCRHMYWVKGEVSATDARYIYARHGEHEGRYDIATGEQVNGRHEDRGPGFVAVLDEASRARIAEGALKKSNYERRNQVIEYLSDVDLARYTTEALERIAAMIAGEEELPEVV